MINKFKRSNLININRDMNREIVLSKYSEKVVCKEALGVFQKINIIKLQNL
jgi:hypothetical protein